MNPNILQKIAQSFDETKVFVQLRQKIGISDISPHSQTYKDLMHYLKDILAYPSSQNAQLHRQANRLGNFDLQRGNKNANQSQNFDNFVNQINNSCECCGLAKQQFDLDFCQHSFKDVACIGISTYMYYRTMINLSYFLILTLLVFGFFALGTNISAASTWNSRGVNLLSSYLTISLGPKIYLATDSYQADQYLLIPQVWLGVAMVLSFIIGYILMQRNEVTEVREIQRLNRSASDFTVVAMGMPLNVNQNQIESAFRALLENCINTEEIDKNNQSSIELSNNKNMIAKISVGIPKILQTIKKSNDSEQQEKKALQKQKQFKQTVVSWIMQLVEQSTFKTPAQQRKRTEKEFNEFKAKNKAEGNKQKSLSKRIIESDVQKAKGIKTYVFVTFESRKTKEKLLSFMENTAMDKFLKYLTLDLYQKKVPILLNDKIFKVRIEQASQPEDVLWENIGTKRKQLFLRKCSTWAITLLILCVSFLTIYGLSTVQYQNQGNRYISFFISLCLSIFNFIILFTLRIVTKYELNVTHTDQQSSLAAKAIIAQLINTIAIPILVNRFLKNHNYLYEQSGLAEDVFLMGITNSFLGPILKIFNVYYFYLKYVNIWRKEAPKNKFYLSQKELNLAYELQQFENGIAYVYIISLYLFTCFFMSLQPIIIIFAIGGYALNYWAQKYCLFQRCKRPVPGTRILYDTMVQFIYAGGLFYSIGSLCFINLVPEDVFDKKINAALIANLIAVGVSVFSLFIPFSFLYELIFGDPNNTVEKEQLFSEDRVDFPSEYDRMNPATKEKAVAEFIKFSNQKKNEAENKGSKQIARYQAIQKKALYSAYGNVHQLGYYENYSAQKLNEASNGNTIMSNHPFLSNAKNQIKEDEPNENWHEVDTCDIVLKFAQNIGNSPESKKPKFLSPLQPSFLSAFDSNQ